MHKTHPTSNHALERPFHRRQPTLTGVNGDGVAERSRHTLECRFDTVVRALSVSFLDMQVETRALGKRIHEIFRQARIEITNPAVLEVELIDEIGSIRNVDSDFDLGLSHGQQTASETSDSDGASERFTKSLADRNSDILDCVMKVNCDIALGLYVEIKQTVAGEGLEHVVEERNARVDVVLPSAVEIHTDLNRGFLGLAVDLRDPRGRSGLIWRHLGSLTVIVCAI